MIPLVQWLRKDLDEWVQACIAPDRIRREGFLEPAAVEAVYAGARRGNAVLAYKLWAVCMFQSWLEAR
jgi:asparagine synthase (glutamine-hydrolysing)